MPSDGVQPNLGTASLTIERSGTYLINFAVSYLYSNNAFVEIFVTANGTRIPGTVASRDAQTAERVKNVAQSALARLTAGTVLQLAAYASTGGNLWLQNDGTVLNAVRVGD
jgi:hypothetical protein